MGWNPFKNHSENTEPELVTKDEFRFARKLVQEDVKVLEDQLAELADAELGDEARACLERALNGLRSADAGVSAAETTDAVLAVVPVLDEARFEHACVLAAREGLPAPTRREPCFFDPQHGPSVDFVMWAPIGGEERQVAACRVDIDHVAKGTAPDLRKIRVGDAWVDWASAGGSVAAAAAYFATTMSGDASSPGSGRTLRRQRPSDAGRPQDVHDLGVRLSGNRKF